MASKDGAVPNYKNDDKAYKKLIYDISINLTSKNLADSMFLSDLPESVCERISNGGQLMEAFHKHGLISFNRSGLAYLSGILKDIRRHDLSGKVDRFLEGREESTYASHGNDKKGEKPAVKKDVYSPISLLGPSAFTVSKKAKSCETHALNENASKTKAMTPKENPKLCYEVDENDESDKIDYGFSKKGFKMKLNFTVRSDSDYYEMDSEQQGYCLIINNIGHETQPLETIFSGMKFKVEMAENKTANEMQSIFQGLANSNLSRFNCLVIFILTDGQHNETYGFDGNKLHIDDIHGPFKSCPSLKRKPKLFFYSFVPKNAKAKRDGSIQSLNYAEYPSEADFCAFFTMPSGISHLCKLLAQDRTILLDDLLNLIRTHAKEENQEIPLTVGQLSKKLKFI
eukprot:gene10348-19048_t